MSKFISCGLSCATCIFLVNFVRACISDNNNEDIVLVLLSIIAFILFLYHYLKISTIETYDRDTLDVVLIGLASFMSIIVLLLIII